MSRIIAASCVVCVLAFAAPSMSADKIPTRPRVSSKPAVPAYALLVITNETNCPVEVSIDDDYIGTCESFATMRIRAKRTGKVTLFGRSYCDTWGPVTRTLKHGVISKWSITEIERDSSLGMNACVPTQQHKSNAAQSQLAEVNAAATQVPVTKRRMS